MPRSLDRARESWRAAAMNEYSSLRQLKDSVRLDSHGSIATQGLRSCVWKIFLLFDTLDRDEWQRTLASSRSAYNSLHAHFVLPAEDPGAAATDLDPLSQETENSTRQRLHKDEDLRAEILQDVERCMLDYTREPETQRMLVDILFTFSKLNPDISYRQGMHEIAAHLLWVVLDDAVVADNSSKALGEDSIIKTVFDFEYVEHDTFVIFAQVMQNAKTFYLSEGSSSIAARSRHIFEELLPQVDGALMSHLQSLDIVPQVFLIRWVRLLFVREFAFEDVLCLWDVIFAEDPSLELVDYICLTLLLRIRWHLLDADYNGALGLLLKYPELDKDLPAQVLGLDALYLKSHLNREGGSYCVLKYTGRPLPESNRPATPPALQRNITTFSGINAARRTAQPRLEGLLQTTAKNLYAQGGKLGLGKAVRNAVDEVHKKAQEIRTAQTPTPPPRRQSRVKELETRNQQLSELLGTAVDELWEYQRSVSEADDQAKHMDNVEKLSEAIAKVQLIQVYLAQPSLQLAERSFHAYKRDGGASPKKPAGNQDAPESKESSSSSALMQEHENHDDHVANSTSLADPASFEDIVNIGQPGDPLSTPTEKNVHTRVLDDAEPQGTVRTKSHRLRPSLEQSSFSFMLGQVNAAEAPRASPSANDRTNASLFGDRPSTPRKANTESNRAGDEDFDILSLKRAKGDRK
ncbi:hypothetical protein CKM354_000307500 [Cercospora kikuchii]|nr:uncharacterized protein CKM354_000307500 [Cercospora kikuchii]GIZ39701.1 hypothetical protein CKM354_000307500 [Cercospora kikuchii]